MESKSIWRGKEWELLHDVNGDYVIYNNETTEEITITFVDKQEFQQLISVLSDELRKESTNFSEKDR